MHDYCWYSHGGRFTFSGLRFRTIADYEEDFDRIFQNFLLAIRAYKHESTLDTCTSNNEAAGKKSKNSRTEISINEVKLSPKAKHDLVKTLSIVGDVVRLTLYNCSDRSDNSSSPTSSSKGRKDKLINLDFLLESNNVRILNLCIKHNEIVPESVDKLGLLMKHGRVQKLRLERVKFSHNRIDHSQTIEPLKRTSGEEETATALFNMQRTNGRNDQSTQVVSGQRTVDSVGGSIELVLDHVSCANIKATFDILLPAIGSKLNRLALRYTETQVRDSSFVPTIRKFCRQLETLELQACHLGSTDDGQDIIQLSSMISSLVNLKKLLLGSNDIDCSGLRNLLECGFYRHPTLYCVDMCSNPLGDDGARHLASFLSATTNVTTKEGNPELTSTLQEPSTKISELQIRDCDISASGCIPVINALAKNTTLRKLSMNLEWNIHSKMIITALQTNMTLHYISIDPPNRNNKDWETIQHYVQLNCAKRRILNVSPQVPLSLWADVMGQNSKFPDLIFHLLQQRPSIVEHSHVN